MEEKIKTIIEAMDDGDKIALWNESCRECGYPDEIYSMDKFNDIMEDYLPFDIVQRTFLGDGFNPNDDYFAFDGYANLVSFDYADDEGSPFYIDNIVDRIVCNESAFGCAKIAAVLNGEDDDEEDDETEA